MSWVTALLASLAGPAGISHVSLPARVSHVGLSCRFSGRDPKAWVLQRGAPGSDGRSGASLQVEKRRVNLPRANVPHRNKEQGRARTQSGEVLTAGEM